MGINGVAVGIHVGNMALGYIYYLIMNPLLVQTGDPQPNKGLLNNQEPTFTMPLQIGFVLEYLRLSVVPSFFYVTLHFFFVLTGDDPGFYNAFSQEADAWTQIAFTMLIMIHCGLRQTCYVLKRNQHRVKVVDDLQLRGNETILDVKCAKGYWTNGVAARLKSGGRIFAMDAWDSPGTPFDGQWAVENSRREEVSGRVEVLNYGDPHYLVFKEDMFDATLCTWLENEDEVNFYNLVSEMVRVTRPGGRLLFIMPYHPRSLLKKNCLDLGLKDVKERLITTTYLLNTIITAEKPEEMTDPPARVDRSENAVTDESPGFTGNMFYCLTAMGFYFVAVYATICKHTWGLWLVPKGLKPADTLAYGFMAENVVWFCWAVVDIHFLLRGRPVYVVKRIGVVNLWFAYALQFMLMVLIFNVTTWAPLMILSAMTGVNSIALRAVFRVLARPCIGSTLDNFFTERRQDFFMSTWKPDYGDKKNQYRKARKNKRKQKKESDLLLDDIEGLEPEDSFAPGF